MSGTGGAVRGRRAPVGRGDERRPSGDDRQRAILETAERLLEERPLAAISIDDLARGAGISRPTFYFYFGGKEDVLLTLLDRMAAEVGERLAALPPEPGDDAPAWWRQVLGVFVDVFLGHRAVSRVLAEARATNPRLRAEWADLLEGWVGSTAAVLERERRRGAAAPGLDAREAALALNLLNERVLAAVVSGESPAPAEHGVLDLLAGVWLAVLYPAPDRTLRA
ncbi:TetR/AcrR family transcriptional regulator [Amnibacterium sp. CER49]|uniref:TetR/AcrR family transcriptional regulator n=1 Tax=Amnibacterium sp. CER49 TaxID=3039161 RepID=UPI00244935FD|nr:TetR/AcrR family transcriptional regulator [Amnibacterium sp. CER49]MDH2443721.1 TetR/AcrR family transcriptional regulator [Amnibacterium sp. CER49]